MNRKYVHIGDRDKEDAIYRLSRNELRDACRQHGLLTVGNKAVLIERLRDHGFSATLGATIDDDVFNIESPNDIPEPFDGFDALFTDDCLSSDNLEIVAESIAEPVAEPVDEEFNVYDELVAHDSPFLI